MNLVNDATGRQHCGQFVRIYMLMRGLTLKIDLILRALRQEAGAAMYGAKFTQQIPTLTFMSVGY